MAIPDEDVAAVRAATDIVALIGEHTGLKKTGRRWVGLCPFHGEKTPSFSVNGEDGLYYCFGCQVSGDAISFLRAIEGCDFVEAVERLAARSGVTIHHNDDPQAAQERAKRQQLYEAMSAAVDFYADRLLAGKDAGPARQYLRSRGYSGDVVREFRLGFAPNAYDELSKSLKFPRAILVAAGLIYVSERGSALDVFRERIIFPIFDAAGKPIAIGGRYLPEELRRSPRDPGPKYRNSPESSIYQKRRTLYGLNWAKTDMAHSGEAIVCEGYTDVLGFHRAGITRAVATCGTALTEDHFRVLARFAKRIVLVFDADAAGQNAAARLYEWERKHELELSVAALPQGSDPGSLAETDPEQLRLAVANARPFLSFRLERVLDGADLQSPEARSRVAERALGVIAEHPNDLVRDEYLRQVADRTHFAPDQLRTRLEHERAAVLRGEREPASLAPARNVANERASDQPDDGGYREYDDPQGQPSSSPPRDQQGQDRAARPPRNVAGPGRTALALAIHRPEQVIGRFDELLFMDPVEKEAFQALHGASELHEAIAGASPAVADLLRQLDVQDLPDEADVNGTVVLLVLIAGDALLRRLDATARMEAERGDLEAIAAVSAQSRYLKEELEMLRDPLVQATDNSPGVKAANRLLAWMQQQEGGVDL